MELWDLLDQDGVPLGATHIRGKKLPADTYHRTVEIFTVNSKNQLLVTLRDPNKDPYPNLWEITGGSVISGEDSLTAAMRELHEETGISVKADEIIFLAVNRGGTALTDIYLCFCDKEISELTLQKGETVDAKWVSFDEFEEMIDAGIVPDPVRRRYLSIKDMLYAKTTKN